MIPLLPEHAIDLSLHTSILLGLVVTWVLQEWFGWVFAGFVVAGYLSALALLAPGTLAVVCLESLVTYVIVWALASGLPQAGVWSRVFGRERFLLFLLAAIPVRLAITGVLLPRLQGHLLVAGWTAEHLGTGLFGVGIVLVPLTANAFWKLGVTRGLVQIGTTSTLTLLAVTALASLTNLGFGAFAQTFDALAVHPFESSRVVLVLVCTVFIAAHNNLRYGWDFGGILVPALLSMLAFTPTRYVTTVLEIAVLYGVYSVFLRLPGVNAIDFGGPRRIVSVYAIAWVTKWAGAFAIATLQLGLPLTDLYGFGYLLTSLVVTRCHKTGSFLKTTTPIVWTSLQGIALAMPIAFGLAHLGNLNAPPTLHPVLDLPGDAALATLALSADVSTDAVAHSLAPDVEDGLVRHRGGPCRVHQAARLRPAPERPLAIDCGGDGFVLVAPSPLGDPDTTWLSAWLVDASPGLSAVVLGSVDPSTHPTRRLHAEEVARETILAAQRLAGDRTVVLLSSAERGTPRLHPRWASRTEGLRASLAVPDLQLDPSGPPARLKPFWDLLRQQDAALSIPPDAVGAARVPDEVSWQDVPALEPDAAPRDLDAFARVVLPAIRRAVARPVRAEVPPHLVTLADMVGGTWFTTRGPSDTPQWVLVRGDDDSGAIDRFLFHAGGTDWTVVASDGWSRPSVLDAAMHHHDALDARATWLAARPPNSASHHVDPRVHPESAIDRITRGLLATSHDFPEPPQVFIVEVAPGSLDGVRVGRASALGGDDVLEDVPEVAAALTPWPGARGVASGTVEASWVASFGLAVHYTRALRPEGLVVAWYPSRLLDEAPRSDNHHLRLEWYRNVGVAVRGPIEGTPITQAHEPDVLAILDGHTRSLTDGSLTALVRHGWTPEVRLHGSRLVVRLRRGSRVCASVSGADDVLAWPWRGCWEVE